MTLGSPRQLSWVYLSHTVPSPHPHSHLIPEIKRRITAKQWGALGVLMLGMGLVQGSQTAPAVTAVGGAAMVPAIGVVGLVFGPMYTGAASALHHLAANCVSVIFKSKVLKFKKFPMLSALPTTS